MRNLVDDLLTNFLYENAKLLVTCGGAKVSGPRSPRRSIFVLGAGFTCVGCEIILVVFKNTG